MSVARNGDYRDSHQYRGASYDSLIFSSPFDAYLDKWEGHHLRLLLPRLFPERIPRYLDFACGTGRITARIERLANASYGIDVSETMLAAARGKCSMTRFICGDLTRGDLDLGFFDLVTAFRFFGNAQDELRNAALAAISRHTALGGYLIINNHRNPHSFLAIAHRFASRPAGMDLSFRKLHALLRRHGFEIVHRRAIGFWIVRARLMTPRILESGFAAGLECAFRHSCFVPFSPDSLVVARKVLRNP